MTFPIFYQGKILFRDGKPAFSINCCCDEDELKSCAECAFADDHPLTDMQFSVGGVIYTQASPSLKTGFLGDCSWEARFSRSDDPLTPEDIGIVYQQSSTNPSIGAWFITSPTGPIMINASPGRCRGVIFANAPGASGSITSG